MRSCPLSSYNRFFPQRLAHALDDAAVHLAFDDDRVDLRAAVIDRDVALQLHLPVAGSTSTTATCAPKET